MRTAVIDASALINVSHLGLARELVLYFDLILVPKAVQEEVNRKSRFRYRLRKLYETQRFQSCRVADLVNIQLLSADLDEGEAEALIQAQEKNATFFIGDEKRARDRSFHMGLTPVGTARILARLHHEGFAGDPRTLVAKLRRDLGFRISETIVEEAIRMAPQPI